MRKKKSIIRKSLPFMIIAATSIFVLPKITKIFCDSSDQKAMALYEAKAANNEATANELYELALNYKLHKDINKAISTLQSAIEKGSTPALTALANIYTSHEGYQNPDEALKLYREAADRNDPIGLYETALCQENGQNSDILLTKSALQSYGPALILKAKRDLEQAKTEADYLAILGMLNIAINLGINGKCPYPEAYKILSSMYEKGLGVPQDSSRAEELLALAQ